MKYAAGSYLLMKFSRVGSKLSIKKHTSYLNAKSKSDKYLSNNPDCSTVILRVLTNSTDINDKWEYKR